MLPFLETTFCQSVSLHTPKLTGRYYITYKTACVSEVGYYIQQIKVYGNDYLLKHYTLNTRLKLYKTTVVPSLFYNVETWSKITKNDMQQLEGMQYRILKASNRTKSQYTIQWNTCRDRNMASRTANRNKKDIITKQYNEVKT